VLLEDSLRGLELVRREAEPVVDVGSGGGAPGIPLAWALPETEVVLLEAQQRKCAFLRAYAPPNVRVLWGRAEEQPVDWAGCALAKALASPPVAAEWCLPLVAPGGAAVLFVGPRADADVVSCASARVGGGPVEELRGLFVVPKLEATPSGFPRRPGVARKRPLA